MWPFDFLKVTEGSQYWPLGLNLWPFDNWYFYGLWTSVGYTFDISFDEYVYISAYPSLWMDECMNGWEGRPKFCVSMGQIYIVHISFFPAIHLYIVNGRGGLPNSRNIAFQWAKSIYFTSIFLSVHLFVHPSTYQSIYLL